MSCLRWFTALSLSSLLLFSLTSHAQAMAEYMATQRALQAKTELATTMNHGVITAEWENSLNQQQTLVNDIQNKGKLPRGQHRAATPYQEYLSYAREYAENPGGNSDHKGTWRYDANGDLIKDEKGKPKFFNSSADQVANGIMDPQEKQKFKTWAEAVDSSFEQQKKLNEAVQAKKDYETILKKSVADGHRPMSQEEYEKLSGALSKMGLSDEKYKTAVEALEKVRAASPMTITKAYPHGQKGISSSCLMKGL